MLPSFFEIIWVSEDVVAVTRLCVYHESVGIAEPSADLDGMTLPTEANMCT